MRTARGRRETARHTVVLVLACAALLSGAGCTGGQTGGGPRSTGSGVTPSASIEPTSTPSTTTPEATGTVALSALKIKLEPVVTGLSKPLYVTGAADGSRRLFVVEQTGRIRVVRDGTVSSGAFLDVSKLISTGGERGLLGLAFAQDYESSGRFYVNYTDVNGDTNIMRHTAENPESDTPRLGRPQRVLKVKQPYANHNGGCLQWAPDGRLWVGMGDGGSAGDPGNRAQDPKELLGKMLSLDVSGKAVPKPRIECLGLRNPWRFSFDPETDDLWIADVGQSAWEEVDVVPFASARGRNFGWHYWEGTHRFVPGGKRDGMTFPVIEYDHRTGESITGGYVYRGSKYPAMSGTYFYADYPAGWVAGARKVGDKVETRTLVEETGGNPSSFGLDDEGELYLCDLGGTVYLVTGGAE